MSHGLYGKQRYLSFEVEVGRQRLNNAPLGKRARKDLESDLAQAEKELAEVRMKTRELRALPAKPTPSEDTQ